MTDPATLEDVVTTTASFESAIKDVLIAAVHNDVNPRGSWVYRNGEGKPDMEVLITELEKRDET